MSGRRLVKQFSWISGGRIVAAILQAATLLIIAVVLGPTDFGFLATALALAVIPQTLSDLGITTFVLRTRGTSSTDGRVTYALRTNNLASALGGGLYAVVVLLCAAAISWNILVFVPLAIWLAAEKNCEVWLSVAVADHDARLNVLILVGRRAAALGLMLGFLVLAANPALSFSLAQAISSTVAAVVAQRIIRRRLPPSFSWTVRELLGETRAYWVHTIATQIRNLDSALTAMVAGPYQAGLYSVASRLTNPLRILPTSLVAVVIPQISRDEGRVSRSTRLLLGLTVLGMAVLYASIALLAPYIVPAVLGDDYLQSVLPIQIVCFGLMFGVTASILAGVLQAKGYGRLVGVASVTTSIFVVTALLLLASVWGAVGAALALASAFLLQTAVMSAGYAFGTRRS